MSRRSRKRRRNEKNGAGKVMPQKVIRAQNKYLSTTSMLSCRVATTISHLAELIKTAPGKLDHIRKNLDNGNISGFFVLCDVSQSASIDKIRANVEKNATSRKHGWVFNHVIFPSYSLLDDDRENFIYRVLNGFAVDAFFDSSTEATSLVTSLRIRALEVKSNKPTMSTDAFGEWIYRLNKYTAPLRTPEEIKQIG